MDMQMKLISPLDKVFLDQEPLEKPECGPIAGFQNEVISFQVAYTLTSPEPQIFVQPRVESPIAEHIRLRSVRHVPVRFTCMPNSGDNYLRKTPGLYPDGLRDIKPHRLHSYHQQWDTLWVDVEPQSGIAPGTYPVKIGMLHELTGEELASVTASVTILPGFLPRQTLIHTKWFHCDGIAQYYHVPVFSEEFWRITENFMRAAVNRGINMILMPTHTPPLDTRQGGERLTVQLVDVFVNDGKYSFGFDKLRRWVDMAARCGVEYHEIAHLFTQWGARATPKIMATVDGVEKRIFGWDVAADSQAYRDFIAAYLPALLGELKSLGIDRQCYFHISDEPSPEHMDNYLKAKALVAPYLEGYTIMDALSNVAFYLNGAVAKPIPSINHMDDFLAQHIPGLWTYYCCGQHLDVSNAFIAMPSARTRILGVQLYKYDIEGFLQWGYNFYNTQFSDYQVDPFAVTDGEAFSPAGDCFQVYPGEDGQPEESIRMMVTLHALQDLRALKMLESLIGRDKVLALIDEGLAEPVSFTRYPRESAYLAGLRRRVNEAILANAAR